MSLITAPCSVTATLVSLPFERLRYPLVRTFARPRLCQRGIRLCIPFIISSNAMFPSWNGIDDEETVRCYPLRPPHHHQAHRRFLLLELCTTVHLNLVTTLPLFARLTWDGGQSIFCAFVPRKDGKIGDGRYIEGQLTVFVPWSLNQLIAILLSTGKTSVPANEVKMFADVNTGSRIPRTTQATTLFFPVALSHISVEKVMV